MLPLDNELKKKVLTYNEIQSITINDVSTKDEFENCYIKCNNFCKNICI